MAFYTLLPPTTIIRARFSDVLKIVILCALIAAGSAQAQLTGISLKGVPYNNSPPSCSSVAVSFETEGSCSSPTRLCNSGRVTIEVSQNGKTGTGSLMSIEYPSSGSIRPVAFLTDGTLTAEEVADALFSVTLHVTDGGKTYTASKYISGCVNPQFIDPYIVQGAPTPPLPAQ